MSIYNHTLIYFGKVWHGLISVFWLWKEYLTRIPSKRIVEIKEGKRMPKKQKSEDGMRFCYSHNSGVGKLIPAESFESPRAVACSKCLKVSNTRGDGGRVSDAGKNGAGAKEKEREQLKFCRGHHKLHPSSNFDSPHSGFCRAFTEETKARRVRRGNALKKAREQKKASLDKTREGLREDDDEDDGVSAVEAEITEEWGQEVSRPKRAFPIYYSSLTESFFHRECDGALRYLNRDEGNVHFRCRKCGDYVSASPNELANMAGVVVESG